MYGEHLLRPVLAGDYSKNPFPYFFYRDIPLTARFTVLFQVPNGFQYFLLRISYTFDSKLIELQTISIQPDIRIFSIDNAYKRERNNEPVPASLISTPGGNSEAVSIAGTFNVVNYSAKPRVSHKNLNFVYPEGDTLKAEILWSGTGEYYAGLCLEGYLVPINYGVN
jgi:hypothetical protein